MSKMTYTEEQVQEALAWYNTTRSFFESNNMTQYFDILADALRDAREERARLLNEAAERAVAWLTEQTGCIDPAIAATNSGKWLLRLREKQMAQLRAAVRGKE